MKTKILLTALMIVMIMGAMAQEPTMTLTFTADYSGQHVPLNSILIENMTNGGDTTLYAPDTVLVLDYVTGMEEVSNFSGNGFSLSKNYPNPMEGKTTIDLHLPESGNVLITIHDIKGRELIRQEIRLEPGSHSFTFFPGGENLYFLTAQKDQLSQTIKMFNSPSNSPVTGYCNLEYNGQKKTVAGEYKSGNAVNNFVFNLGDQLQYTATTALGNRIIIDTPSGTQTYTFQYGSGGMPCPNMPTVTDIDGNVYNTVLIGTQCWMKENLKTTTYRNGTAIPNVPDAGEWQVLTTGAYVWYDNVIFWKGKYGALYNWFTVVDPNGICPTGWHVPSNDEWTDLTNYIGGMDYPHGNELKSCRQVNSPLGGGCNTSVHPRYDTYTGQTNYGTDDYGFSGLPGGHRFDGGLFSAIGGIGTWWSTTEGQNGAWTRSLSCDLGLVHYSFYTNMRGGNYVRCLRNLF